jgi:hypothetical protein
MGMGEDKVCKSLFALLVCCTVLKVVVHEAGKNRLEIGMMQIYQA